MREKGFVCNDLDALGFTATTLGRNSWKMDRQTEWPDKLLFPLFPQRKLLGSKWLSRACLCFVSIGDMIDPTSGQVLGGVAE